MKYLIILVSLFVMSSCAGFDNLRYYSEAPTYEVIFEEKPFTIYDKSEVNSAFITEKVDAGEFATAAFEGLTLGLLDFTLSPRMFEGALKIYLNEYKTNDCTIIRTIAIPDGLGGTDGYEIFYKCD